MDGYLMDFSHLDSFQKWALICAAALTILYAVMRPWRKRNDPLARAPTMSLASQREVEKQMTALVVELEQMARQMTAQLDTRSEKLEALIRQADQRLAALQSARAANEVIPVPARPSVQLPDPRHADVYSLADTGRSPRQIAQQLGRPYGEIELILALREPEKSELAS